MSTYGRERPVGNISFLVAREESNPQGKAADAGTGTSGPIAPAASFEGICHYRSPSRDEQPRPCVEEDSDALPAALDQHQNQTQSDDDKQGVGFKIVAAAKEAIPRPEALSKR
jgi:hypothetical protein